MYNFCTLFDSNYLYRGLALYESLKKYMLKDFHLYMFAFDQKSYDILTGMSLDNVTVVSLSEFEDEKLLNVKPTRGKGEYCWTCTSSTILYVLKNYKVDSCTYLDSDLYFYSSPVVLLDELKEEDSVLITEHRYTPEYDQTDTSGKYCVQFITFKNDEKGLKVLNWWRDACIEWCYARAEDGKFGDQKYLDDWTIRFEGVHELKHLGGGVAPWNCQQYDIHLKNGKIFGIEKNTKKEFDLVFYHFHNIKFNESNNLDIGFYKHYELSKHIQKIIYLPYLKHLKQISKAINTIDNSFNTYKKIHVPFSWYRKKFYRKIELLHYLLFQYPLFL